MILVFSKEITPRLEYTTGLIFRDILGTDAEVTTDTDRFILAEGPKINYSDTPLMAREVRNEHQEIIPTGLFLKAAPLLFETGLRAVDPLSVSSGDETGFFETSPDSFLPFDPFASAFLVVSRMEEYLPGPRDRFGRFPAASSLLFRNGLLEKPVVNRWAWLIAGVLEKHYQKPLFPEKKFTFLPTIDIDNAWAFRNKGFLRTLAASLRDLVKAHFGNFRKRFRVITGREADPYDSYDYLKALFKGHEENVLFFFLMGDYALFDKQVSWKNKPFRELIAEIGRHFEVGIHPSFVSSESGHHDLTETEKKRLEEILGRKVTQSRQHYLRINLPETYLKLIDAGITEDYSMGYPECPGFRAGICTPFPFYDLTREKVTSLRIFPFQIMEMTFSQYLNLNISETKEKIRTLMEEINAAGGLFIAVWHNETLGESIKGKEFREVFEEMVSTGFRYAY